MHIVDAGFCKKVMASLVENIMRKHELIKNILIKAAIKVCKQH